MADESLNSVIVGGVGVLISGAIGAWIKTRIERNSSRQEKERETAIEAATRLTEIAKEILADASDVYREYGSGS